MENISHRSIMKRRARKPAADEKPGGPHPWQSLRKAQVARAKKLVKNADYPPKKVLQDVAHLLARHLPREKR